MKIWWQSSTPIHRLHDYRNALTAHLDSVKRPDTEIHINGVDDGSMDLHYNAVVAINSYGPGGVLNKIMQAADQGYDAVAIGCFLDPAMQEAREVVPIPVMGLGEASMMAACMYGAKFSGVAFTKNNRSTMTAKRSSTVLKTVTYRSAIWASTSTKCRRASPIRGR